MMAGFFGRLSGQAPQSSPPDWLVELLRAERQARLDLAKRIDDLAGEQARQAEAHATEIARVEAAHAGEIARVEQAHKVEIDRVEAKHKTEIDRVELAHKREREQLLEQLGRQQGYIEFMRRAAELETAAAVAQHTAIGALEEGLKDARERLTRQRVIADGRHRETIRHVERARNDLRFLLAEFGALDAEHVAAVPGSASRLAKIRSLIEIADPPADPPVAPPSAAEAVEDATYEDA